MTTMAYAVGGVSGGHFNPAVTVGSRSPDGSNGGRYPGYVATKLVAATVAGGGALDQLSLFLIAPTVGGAVAGLIVRSLGQGGNDGADVVDRDDPASPPQQATTIPTVPNRDTVPLPAGASDETTPLPLAGPGPGD